MATLSFHAPALTERKIRSAARKRGIPVSRFLRETAELAAALSTPSKLIVTLNPRDFVPAAAFGLRVLSPSEARRDLL